MANDYYEVVRGPVARQRARAEVIVAEFQAIATGLGRLPSINDLAGMVHVLAEEASASAADVYVLTSDYPIKALKTGTTVRWFVKNTNTGASTVNVDGTGVKNIKDAAGGVLAAAALAAGRLADIVYDGVNLRLQNSAKSVTVSIALSQALSPQNYQKDVAIADLTLSAATGGTSPYTYAAAGLPAGLAFAPRTRVVSGTPTTIGTNNVTYTVTDANGNSFVYQFQIRVVAQIVILPDPVDRTLVVGSTYSFTMTVASGGTAPYIYSMEGLPDGMTFDPETREITGVPSTPGVYNVILSVVDRGSPKQTESQSFTMTVRSANILSLQTVRDRSFVPGSLITPFTLPAANGGVPAYVYIVTGLGEGLAFDADTRVVSGTPTTIGERDVTFRVEDGEGTIVEQQFIVSIETAGSRYIAVTADRAISATEILAGNSYLPTAQELTLPAWTGNRYIVIAQPATHDDLTSISLAGLGNSFSDFEKQSYTRAIDGIDYEIWVGIEVQGDPISGEVIEVRP